MRQFYVRSFLFFLFNRQVLSHSLHYNTSLFTIDPRKAPLLPRSAIGTMARISFNTLLLPLFYGSIASAVGIDTIGDYWFVIVGGFLVMAISYVVATLVHYAGCGTPTNPLDFVALRIAATFPNVAVLPILIFPSLCEFPVVHEAFFSSHDNPEMPPSSEHMQKECTAQANTMIFCYFFSWNIAFWILGNPQLLRAGQLKRKEQAKDQTEITLSEQNDEEANGVFDNNDKNDEISTNESKQSEGEQQSIASVPHNHDDTSTIIQIQKVKEEEEEEEERLNTVDCLKGQMTKFCSWIWNIIKQPATSPGFIAMILALITASISPLQRALFDSGGALRFLGSAVETLGVASAPLSTIVVAATLVPPEMDKEDDEMIYHESQNHEDSAVNHDTNAALELDDKPVILIDPNSRPNEQGLRRQQFQSFRQSISQSSKSLYHKAASVTTAIIPRSTQEMRKLHVWFCVSRLVITPAVIVGLIMAMDYTEWSVFQKVPNLAKLVRKN